MSLSSYVHYTEDDAKAVASEVPDVISPSVTPKNNDSGRMDKVEKSWGGLFNATGSPSVDHGDTGKTLKARMYLLPWHRIGA